MSRIKLLIQPQNINRPHVTQSTRQPIDYDDDDDGDDVEYKTRRHSHNGKGVFNHY